MTHDPWGNPIGYQEPPLDEWDDPDDPAVMARQQEDIDRANRNGGHNPYSQTSQTSQTDDGGNSEVSEVSEWTDPLPVGGAGAVPPFPVDTLPPWLRNFTVDVAHAKQVPVDLAGVLALGALATAMTGRVDVEVRSDWIEPANIYVAVAMPPGERKSPVLRAFVNPLLLAEKAAAERAAPNVVEQKARKAIADRAAAVAQERAAKADGDARLERENEAIEAAQYAAGMKVPPVPRLLSDDATPQAFTTLLAEHGRISVMTDEGDLFDILAGRHANGQVNIGVYLKAWDGSEIRVDRVGRPPEYIPRPLASITLAVQPEVLRQIAGRPGFRGRGLLGRFLWSLPASRVGHRLSDPPAVPTETSDTYVSTMTNLTASVMGADRVVLKLDANAKRRVISYSDDIEVKLRVGGALSGIPDWGAKLVGEVVRIAGLLHVADHFTDPGGWASSVDEATMRSAIEIGGYFEAHARAAFDYMGADDVALGAKRILGWLRATEAEAFTRRAAQQGLRSHFPVVSDIDPALDRLVDHGWIRPQTMEPARGPGRRPSPAFEVNPSAHKPQGDAA